MQWKKQQISAVRILYIYLQYLIWSIQCIFYLVIEKTLSDCTSG